MVLPEDPASTTSALFIPLDERRRLDPQVDLSDSARAGGALVRVLGKEGAHALDSEDCDVQGLLAGVEGLVAIFDDGEQERIIPRRVFVAENTAGG